jgi:hypothetical protein
MNFGKKAAPNNAEYSLNERRGAVRVPGDGAYAVVFLPTGYQFPATVVDYSTTGALLTVDSVLGIPAAFDVQFRHGPKRRVRLVRRGPRKIAVKFV